MEEDLRARLIGDATIAASVKKAAIAWGDRPQASGLPAITLETVADKLDQHMTDFQALQSTQVQVDVWGADKLQARDLRLAVIAALAPPVITGATRFGRSFIIRRNSSSESTDTGVIYRELIDFDIWHAPAA